jgi:tetrahydrodipicolinate N-succinyltransferase
MLKLLLVHLEVVLVSVQDRCTVGAKCSIGSGIILDAPDGTPR